ncbi:MAG: helix-turn-helix domain-containing protein [Fimbriimonadales bacterium]
MSLVSHLHGLLGALRRPRVRIALLLALILLPISATQWVFVRTWILRSIQADLLEQAKTISGELEYQDTWNLTPFRRSQLPRTSTWIIVGADGLLIDVEGPPPELLGRARKIPAIPSDSVSTYRSSANETWRLVLRKLTDGVVLVGVRASEVVPSTDASLLSASARFGNSVSTATALQTRDIADPIEFAVVGDSLKLERVWGGIPLELDGPPAGPDPGLFQTKAIGRRRFMLIREAFRDPHGSVVGWITIPRDITLEQGALSTLLFSNLGLGILAFLLAVFFVLREMPKRFKPIDLDRARKEGEGQTIEFKSSFSYAVNEETQNPHVQATLQAEVLASIVAFLNADGGTVFIGVDDARTIRGIAEDLQKSGGSTDLLQQALHFAIRDKIGPAYRGLVECRFIPSVSPQVLALDVQPAPRSLPAFLKGKIGPEFYLRQGSSSQKLDAEQQYKHFRMRP